MRREPLESMRLLIVAIPSLLSDFLLDRLLGVPSVARPASYTFTTIDVRGAVMTVPTSIVGVDYGPFRDGQSPDKGVFPSSQQLKDDMPVLKVIADAIRTFSTTNGFENIVGFAEQEGLNVAPGAWLSDNATTNALETDNLITVAQQHDNVLFAVVGSEAILRFVNGFPQGLSKNAVIAQINKVKANVSVPVTTAEPWHIWRDNPDLVNAVDFIFLNIHPYWEKQHIDNAVSFVFAKYTEIKNKYPGKKVIISETGWPSGGNPNGPAQPSLANQKKFITEFLKLVRKEKIDFFHFAAFDEKWKVAEPNGVGPHWGFYLSDRTPKHSIMTLRLDRPAVDFDGDGVSDIAVFRSGAWLFHDFASGAPNSGVWTGSSAGCIPVGMDYDGDGMANFTQFCIGAWHFYNSDGSYNKGIWTGGVAGDRPVPADYDGDGTGDVVVYRGGAWLFFNFTTGAFDAAKSRWTGGGGSCIPAPMDYDGDGSADFTQLCNGAWHFYNSDGSYNKGIWTGGVAGDLPVPADYDGDGTDDVVVFRGGAWLFYDFATGAFDSTKSMWTGAPAHWTGGTSLPAPLDYDGDGAVDFTVYSGGPWHFFNSNGTYNKGIWTGGIAGDQALSRRLLP
jgi:exo-beta-1,3-glucanase (GH17 family)